MGKKEGVRSRRKKINAHRTDVQGTLVGWKWGRSENTLATGEIDESYPMFIVFHFWYYIRCSPRTGIVTSFVSVIYI